MELARQIRQRRTERGLSQDELATAIFVSRQTVSNWETDKTYPDVQSLLLLSQLFGVSTDELIQGDVAVMRRAMEEDAKKIRQLTAIMVVMLALAVAFFIALVATWQEPLPFGNLTKGDLAGFAAFAPLFALGTAAAVQVERIKRRHDLVTYHEIMAFVNGEPLGPERQGHRFARNHPVATAIIKLAFGAVVGAALGVMAYKLFG